MARISTTAIILFIKRFLFIFELFLSLLIKNFLLKSQKITVIDTIIKKIKMSLTKSSARLLPKMIK